MKIVLCGAGIAGLTLTNRVSTLGDEVWLAWTMRCGWASCRRCRRCHSWGCRLVVGCRYSSLKELTMRVFVAGATGAIGRQLVPRLLPPVMRFMA